MHGLQHEIRERAGRGTGKVVQGRNDQSSAADIPDDARDLDNARDDDVVYNLQENATIITLLSLSCHYLRMAMPITVPTYLHRPISGGWLWMLSVVRSLYTLAIRPVAARKL